MKSYEHVIEPAEAGVTSRWGLRAGKQEVHTVGSVEWYDVQHHQVITMLGRDVLLCSDWSKDNWLVRSAH
jgi:hypothetical protein